MLKIHPKEALDRWRSIPKEEKYQDRNKIFKELWCLSKFLEELNISEVISYPENQNEKSELEPADLKVSINGAEELFQVTEVHSFGEEPSHPNKEFDELGVAGNVNPSPMVINQINKKNIKYPKSSLVKLNLLIYWNTRGIHLDIEEYGLNELVKASQATSFKRVYLLTNAYGVHILKGSQF